MIDSHCHLADEQFAADLDAVIARARAAGVDGALCILDALNEEEGVRADRVAAAWPDVAFAVGVHPHQAAAVEDAAGGNDGVAAFVRRTLAARDRACAIGEIGLDYHYDFAPRETQIEVFRRQIALARELRRPIVVHTREADDDTVDALRAEARGDVQGVFHCFTGDAAFARRALDLGFHVSFSGIVTFRNAAAIREAAAIVPSDRLLAETDSPYLSPVPYRGRRNEPARIEVFRRQIALARELRRPIVVHTREADDDTVDALRAEARGDVQGVFHCFTGDAAFARRALDLGFHVSFSGIVTFRNAAAIREAAAIVPSDRLLAETDSPYLSPVPYRGRRNEPARVAQVMDALAEVRRVSRDDIAAATRQSYVRLFAGRPNG